MRNLSGDKLNWYWNSGLGPVNTMRLPIDVGHFFAGPGALSVVYHRYMSERVQRRPAEKWPRSAGLALKSHRATLRIVYLEATKLHSTRLAWHHLKANAGHPHSVNRP